MAVIYLRHPVHGEKVCSTDIEAKIDRENGWTDFDPNKRDDVPSFLAPPGGSDLPVDFPGREALIEAGFTKWAQVAPMTDEQLLQVKGVGFKTVEAIRKVLDS